MIKQYVKKIIKKKTTKEFIDKEQISKNLDEEAKKFFYKVDDSRRLDDSFAKLGDKPLSQEEKAEIDAFWGKYKFAYPNIDYKSFQTFKNRSGYFDVRHCPGAIRTQYFHKYWIDSNYNMAFQNKPMLDFLYPDIQKPRTIVRRMSGIYYDENYNPITLNEVVRIVYEYTQNVNNLIIKPSGLGGGAGIVFFKKESATPEQIKHVITVDMGIRAFVIQEVLQQSEFMKQFNASSVNTIRITSLLFKGKVYPLAALIRVGKTGCELDNYCSGGSLLGIDINTGKCNNWAMANDHSKIECLPSGLNLKDNTLVVPNFEEVKRIVCKSHYRCPYIKLISWDIALDKNNIPILIECNFAGMIQIHEAVTGPLFGDLMEELLDEYLLKRFFIKFATEDFICKEFYDHVVITEYIGTSSRVVVPEELRDKPVTLIEATAFKNRDVQDISAPVNVIKNSSKALATIKIK